MVVSIPNWKIDGITVASWEKVPHLLFCRRASILMPVSNRQSLRLQTPGIVSVGEPFEILVDGHAITARPGESVAAALTAAGVLRLRTNERGGERGMYCGMGACFEC